MDKKTIFSNLSAIDYACDSLARYNYAYVTAMQIEEIRKAINAIRMELIDE